MLAIGGINGSDRQSSIFELSFTRLGDVVICEWRELEQKLQFPRMNHVSMLIPDELSSC